MEATHSYHDKGVLVHILNNRQSRTGSDRQCRPGCFRLEKREVFNLGTGGMLHSVNGYCKANYVEVILYRSATCMYNHKWRAVLI